MYVMAFLHFEEQVRERQKIQKHLKRTTAWDQVMKYVREYSEGLGEMAEKSGNYTELHFL